MFIPAILPAHIDAAVSTRADSAIRRHKLNALSSYLDTLFPGEGLPRASELKLHEYLVTHALEVENYVQLLSLGCYWLNAQSAPGGNFVLIDEAMKVDLVTRMETSTAGSLERQFFERTLSDATKFYYAHPRTWRGLGFKGPPQPTGFPDYARAPS
jgi:hypothetical protein